jgi:hypothetical protein
VKRWVSWLIYASVILGIALLAQLYLLNVPSWLFYSILAGWSLYLATAIAVVTSHEKAYPVTLVLAIVTLVVSLPQQEHYSFAETGQILAFLTFLVGSIIQVGVILLSGSILILKRRLVRIQRS